MNEIAVKNQIPLSTLDQRYLFFDRVMMEARKISQIQSTVSDWEQGVSHKKLFQEITNTINNTIDDY